MDKAISDSLDQYIGKLQEVAEQLRTSRTKEFRLTKRNLPAIAHKSATDFLAYCALVALFRRNICALSEPSCVAVIVIPSQWQLKDVHDAAKIILKDKKGVKFCLHPTSKRKHGWEINPAEFLESGEKLIVFIQEGCVVHEDFELAANFSDRLAICDIRHLRALAIFRRCGSLTKEQAAVIAEQASERMEAIFRWDQPASRAAMKLLKVTKVAPGNERLLDVSKGFGEASLWAEALKRDLADWRGGKITWAEVDKGCLLYGPPGTGKTRFAAALADHCGLHLEATSIPKWQSYKDGDLGDMLKAMYQAFRSAKENAPCLLFLDEFDAIGDRVGFHAELSRFFHREVSHL